MYSCMHCENNRFVIYLTKICENIMGRFVGFLKDNIHSCIIVIFQTKCLSLISITVAFKHFISSSANLNGANMQLDSLLLLFAPHSAWSREIKG